MSIVDLAKARAFADGIEDETAAEWILSLADEVESLQRALFLERRDGQALAERVGKLTDERDQLHAGLEQVLRQVVALLSDIGRRAS